MAKNQKPAKRTHPPTSLRLDPELVYRAKRLALDNERDGRPERTVSQVMNAALVAYLDKKGG